MTTYYTILSYDPFIVLSAKSTKDTMSILKSDYEYIKEEGYDGITKLEEFKPLIKDIELYNILDKYMLDNNLDKVVVTYIGANEHTQLYYKCKNWYANDLHIVYPTYADKDTIVDYSKHHTEDFIKALSSAMDLSLKNYCDGEMGPFSTIVSDAPKEDPDIIGYVMIPVKVFKTPILSFSQTREDQ